MRARVLISLGLIPAWLTLVLVTGVLAGHVEHDSWKPINSALTLLMTAYVLLVLLIWLRAAVSGIRNLGHRRNEGPKAGGL